MNPDLAVVLAVPLGLVIGLAVGMLGGGGSIIAVPLLVYGFGQDVVAATTGSLVVVGWTAMAGSIGHHRAGRVRWVDGLVFGLLGAGGAYLGSRASVAVPQAVLLAAFAVLLVVVAVLMTRRRRAQARAADAGSGAQGGVRPGVEQAAAARRTGRHRLLVVTTATGVGLLTGFFGVGGGFAVVPALVLALGMGMTTAVGTSLVVITVNTVVALLSRLSQPVDLDPVFLLVFGASAVIGSLLGVRTAGRVAPARLSLAFTVLLLVIAVFTGVRSVTELL
ncbi:sulfite exporter TauE/SafE family protein [Actinotalea sp.]|uniref:sulfite exporter TauE/SafE family protein n=1 Tax=Actinotalea sp. TaxID=1872145 RepID=UPI003566DA67